MGDIPDRYISFMINTPPTARASGDVSKVHVCCETLPIWRLPGTPESDKPGLTLARAVMSEENWTNFRKIWRSAFSCLSPVLRFDRRWHEWLLLGGKWRCRLWSSCLRVCGKKTKNKEPSLPAWHWLETKGGDISFGRIYSFHVNVLTLQAGCERSKPVLFPRVLIGGAGVAQLVERRRAQRSEDPRFEPRQEYKKNWK